MMGIITEDKMGDVIIKMIDNVGLDNTFKMIGHNKSKYHYSFKNTNPSACFSKAIFV